MRWYLPNFAKRVVLLLGVAVAALSCSNDENHFPNFYGDATIQLYIDELLPVAMTSCNYASNIDREMYDLRLKLWVCKKVGSDYYYTSRQVYSDSTIFNIDELPSDGEYFLYGWADYIIPYSGDFHYNTQESLACAIQRDYAINDDSYAAYAFSARIKNGKLVDSNGAMHRATTKYRIVTEDEELAAKVATIVIDHNTIATGLNTKTMENVRYDNVIIEGEKASLPDEPRCLATAYLVIDDHMQTHSREHKMQITLKDANGEVIAKYSKIYAQLHNDFLTTIVLPEDSFQVSDYYLSAYNTECTY